MEYQRLGRARNPPEHEANLVFTRMLAGPMDYTPGILSMKGAATTCRSPSTLAKQLGALRRASIRPIQMAADLLENYEANPAPFQFIKDVPVDWDDSRVIDGEVGDFAIFARKDRKSDDWYLGRGHRRAERASTCALDFLDPAPPLSRRNLSRRRGRRLRTNARHPHRAAHRRRRHPHGLRLAPGGGAAVRFVPLGGKQ